MSIEEMIFKVNPVLNVFVIKNGMAHRESKIFVIGFSPVWSKISTAQVGLVIFISVSLSSIMSIPAKVYSHFLI